MIDVNRLDKYYRMSRQIAGHLGDDLLHHVLERNNFFRGAKINNMDGYIYRLLRNEFINKRSSFRKLLKSDPVEFDTEKIGKYDTNLVHTILLQLEVEGYEQEVKVFRECYFNRNEVTFSMAAGVDRRVTKKICTFVKNEIKKRYVLEDSEL